MGAGWGLGAVWEQTGVGPSQVGKSSRSGVSSVGMNKWGNKWEGKVWGTQTCPSPSPIKVTLQQLWWEGGSEPTGKSVQ